MKHKFIFLLFLVFLLLHLYISWLNPETVRFYVDTGRKYFYEMSLANFVTASFVFGLIVSLVISFLSDIKRFMDRWREGRREKKKGELREIFERAKLHYLRGEGEKALELYNRLLRSAPDMEEAYLPVADMYIAVKEYDKADQILDLAEKNLGKRESISCKRVKIHAANKDTVKLERDLKDTLKLNESNYKAMGMLRDLYICDKKWDAALDLEKKLKKQLKTDDENRRFIGIRYEKAKEQVEKADARQYDAILKELKEIIGEQKRFIPGYTLTGEVYERMGKLNDAGRVYGRGYAKTGHIVFLLKMEDLYINRREPGVILKIYRRLLDVSPRNPLVMFLYARLCLRLEMIDEAIDMLNTLFAEEETFRGLHRAMAEAYIHRGEFEKAVGEFRKAFPIEQVYIPFLCEKCQAVREEWSDFCESCFSWNTINVRQEDLFQKDTVDLRQVYEQDWGAADGQ
jgi:uncharacterized protein HemY